MSARAALGACTLAAFAAFAVTTACARAATLRVPAGTTVALRPLAPVASSGTLPTAVVLQVDADVTIGGHLVFARGALARGTLERMRVVPPPDGRRAPAVRQTGSGTPRLRIEWILDTSGDKVTTTGTLAPTPLPLVASIRAQDVNVPGAYDPANR